MDHKRIQLQSIPEKTQRNANGEFTVREILKSGMDHKRIQLQSIPTRKTTKVADLFQKMGKLWR